MRVFIGIELESQAKQVLSNFIDSLKDSGLKANFVKAENIHLTLAFIGETNDIDNIKSVLKNIKYKAFNISTKSLGYFRSKRGNIMWLGFDDTCHLKALAQLVHQELKQNKISFDSKNFIPHLTLARKADIITIPENRAPKINIKVSRISLMQSIATCDGVMYKSITYQDL